LNLRVVAFGQRMPAWVDAGWDEYARRMPKEFALTLVALKAEPRDRGRTADQMLAAEAKRIALACKNADVIALDERGQPWTTRVLADHLSRWSVEAREIAFVIGSADGLADSVKRGAHAIVALSALTLPHGLVRILVAEQLYRAVSLLSRHPYHRE
jgi:23S rRNA (pseudouridine1915-N3)-methyltransferase